MPVILKHQKPVFEKLVAVGKACFSMHRNTLPIAPRTNTLLIGPSGSGKTFLAQAVAKHLDADFMKIAAGDWILLGCSGRGAVPTWSSIFRFLRRSEEKQGAIILLDEVDKLGAFSASSWERHLLVEAFGLLDFCVPRDLADEGGDRYSERAIGVAQETLSNRTLIIGAGAFQHLWDRQSKARVGFFGEVDETAFPTLTELGETLPRELVNRFRASLLILPQLGVVDYRAMLNEMASKVPVDLRESFILLGEKRIPEAARLGQGARFLEETLLDALILEQEALGILNGDAGRRPIQIEPPPAALDGF